MNRSHEIVGSEAFNPPPWPGMVQSYSLRRHLFRAPVPLLLALAAACGIAAILFATA